MPECVPQQVNRSIPVRLLSGPNFSSDARIPILLLKLGERIGDFVTAIESFRIIRNFFTNADITLICLPSLVEIAASTRLFDQVLGFPYVYDVIHEGRVPKMDLADQIAAFKSLLSDHYFLAIDFRHDGSTRHWLDEINAQYRAGFASYACKRLDIALPEMEWQIKPSNIKSGHVPVHSENRLTLLAHAIVETFKARPSLAEIFPDLEPTKEQHAYQKLATERRLKIGISLGAGSELRQWPLPYWLKLLRQLIQEHNAVIIFCGSEADKQPTQELIAGLSPENCNDLTGIPSLAELPSYFKLMDAYIGCDTGLTHLAAGLGVPTVNIFAGISNVPVWRAKGPKVKTIYAEVVCAPCHLRLKQECPNSNICMTAIIPEIVYAGFQQLIPVKAASVRTE